MRIEKIRNDKHKWEKKVIPTEKKNDRNKYKKKQISHNRHLRRNRIDVKKCQKIFCLETDIV